MLLRQTFFNMIYIILLNGGAMIRTIYLDVYFIFNLLMDMAVLFITREILKSDKHILRVLAASTVGAVYATFLLVMNRSGLLLYFITYFVMAYILSVIAYGFSSFKESIWRGCMLYFTVFLLNGVINLSGNNTTFWSALFLSALCCLAVKNIIKKIRQRVSNDRYFYIVKIYYGKDTITAKALADTGNSLVEPITKKPVSIIENIKFKNLNKEKMKLIYVPYNSIGKEGGLMEAYIADKMVIDDMIINKPIIGLYNGKLSHNNQYNMILHPNLMNKEK